jgi:hypothetical protein
VGGQGVRKKLERRKQKTENRKDRVAKARFGIWKDFTTEDTEKKRGEKKIETGEGSGQEENGSLALLGMTELWQETRRGQWPI